MRGTPTPQLRTSRRAGHRVGWQNLLWKLLLALLLLLITLLDVRVPQAIFVALTVLLLVSWGGLFVGACGLNLFGGPPARRSAWVALAAGAYLTLAITGIVKGTPVLSDALGPVVALTLVPHLGRRDLQGALRDWAVVMALALYTAIGIISMWLLITTLRLPVLFIAVLIPPIIFEVALLLFGRLRIKPGIKSGFAIALASLFGMSVFSLTQLHPNTPAYWSLLFGLVVGALIGGALLVSLLTRSLMEAAAGERSSLLLRSFVELSYSAILISVAIYIPLRLLGRGG